MYDRFTDRARKVMQCANQEAHRLEHEYIGTDHILLGILKEGSGGAIAILQHRHRRIDLAALKQAIEQHCQPGDGSEEKNLPQTPSTKLALAWAVKEADAMVSHNISTEHLLLGLLHYGVASVVLASFGLTLEEARETLTKIRKE